MNIRPVATAEDREYVRSLSVEYLRWVFTELNAEFDAGWDVDAVTGIVDEWMPTLKKFSPPDGQFLLVYVAEEAVGMGALRKLSDDICEIKRMYVRPAYRGQGLGKAILNALLEIAREGHFRIVRLDSPKISRSARALYRSMGFYDIEPYAETEAGLENASLMLFMEMKLGR